MRDLRFKIKNSFRVTMYSNTSMEVRDMCLDIVWPDIEASENIGDLILDYFIDGEEQ